MVYDYHNQEVVKSSADFGIWIFVFDTAWSNRPTYSYAVSILKFGAALAGRIVECGACSFVKHWTEKLRLEHWFHDGDGSVSNNLNDITA